MKKIEIQKEFGSILLIVPHQDDEILMAGGIIQKAVSLNIETRVVMATNGDCGSKDYSIGRARLKETLESLAYLGLPPENIIFLGYADTGMSEEKSFLNTLYQASKSKKVYFSDCSSHTYGLEDKPDFHTMLYGEAAEYTRRNFYHDLKSVILKYRPSNIFTTSLEDMHGDHSALFRFVTDILGEAKLLSNYSPRLFSGIVHSCAGDENWPLREEKIGEFTCPDAFDEGSLLKWEERILFPLPKSMLLENRQLNKKYLALSMHRTALKPDAVDFLYSFLKSEELFWEITNIGEEDGTATTSNI